MKPKIKVSQIASEPDDRAIYDYILKIFVIDDNPEVDVRVAISIDKKLDIFNETTPIEYHFSSSRYYIFYENLNKSTRVRAEIYTNEFEKVGISIDSSSSAQSGTSGRGKFIRDPISHIHSCGGDG